MYFLVGVEFMEKFVKMNEPLELIFDLMNRVSSVLKIRSCHVDDHSADCRIISAHKAGHGYLSIYLQSF